MVRFETVCLKSSTAYPQARQVVDKLSRDPARVQAECGFARNLLWLDAGLRDKLFHTGDFGHQTL
jgi:hypothetical protein